MNGCCIEPGRMAGISVGGGWGRRSSGMVGRCILLLHRLSGFLQVYFSACLYHSVRKSCQVWNPRVSSQPSAGSTGQQHYCCASLVCTRHCLQRTHSLLLLPPYSSSSTQDPISNLFSFLPTLMPVVVQSQMNEFIPK